MSRRTIAAGAADNDHEQLRAWIADPDSIKPGSRNAQHASGRAGRGSIVGYLEIVTVAAGVGHHGRAGNPAADYRRMWSSEAAAAGWATTVDHKQIGILYIVTSLVFWRSAGSKRW